MLLNLQAGVFFDMCAAILARLEVALEFGLANFDLDGLAVSRHGVLIVHDYALTSPGGAGKPQCSSRGRPGFRGTLWVASRVPSALSTSSS